MDTVRIGIAGMGGIGRHHADYLLEGAVENARLAAVCAPHSERLATYAQRGIPVFDDAAAMIRSGLLDAILIATPHTLHVPIALAALNAGLHVLVEKPVAAHKAEAERLIAVAHAHPGLRVAVMFQLRTEPRYTLLRDMLRKGDAGTILRIDWTATDWFRSDAYYAANAWRATWRGEGGGVLINQSLHQLDALQWLFGMPSRVRGFCALGRHHDLEVEDCASAHLEWAGGASGTFTASTGELPGVNRLEIAGTRGRLLLENDRLTFDRLEVPSDVWSRTAPPGFARPGIVKADIPFANAAAPHAAVARNFVASIRDNAPLLCPVADGVGALELANAIVYSSVAGRTVDLPLDSAAYSAFLDELIANERPPRRVAATPPIDIAKSFRK